MSNDVLNKLKETYSIFKLGLKNTHEKQLITNGAS